MDGEHGRDVKYGMDAIWVFLKKVYAHIHPYMLGMPLKHQKMVTVVAFGKETGRQEKRDGKAISFSSYTVFNLLNFVLCAFITQ